MSGDPLKQKNSENPQFALDIENITVHHTIYKIYFLNSTNKKITNFDPLKKLGFLHCGPENSSYKPRSFLKFTILCQEFLNCSKKITTFCHKKILDFYMKKKNHNFK